MPPRRLPLALLLASCLLTPPASAQNSEQNRYYVQQMIELAATNDDNGVTAMQRVLEQSLKPTATDPAGARAALQRGLAALEQNELTTALSAFQQASRADASNIEASNYLGLVYRKLDRLTEAESTLQLTLVLEPARAVAWFQLAQVYGLQKDPHRALGALANTYRFAQNPMRAEEILRNIAENETVDTLRDAALAALRLYHLPAEAAIVPPLPANPDIKPLNARPGSRSGVLSKRLAP
ncbi:MAG: tetratricopeptide repeat protein [Candidatus Competibacteraceae bacterium]|nr:tetratricopeptide repeat protein [Candidatus Competibacteraceae bacterium]MBK7982679.1 tetratricopeptide repeat protein [Candidatus Competibacteraceae bacterium]MBK8898775.1 tetratricopeptide repeat protein [Candidatus Competibacteraceae bacterium]MBK8962571.1 tetratricopeptide repeat protein [Candidatus Competibacteraceae bacterium]MBK9951789.1 tetratricopeptide repeat protein [Candidatus Competibacteraceae bacterium]